MSLILSNSHAYQQNLSNFSDIHELHADTIKREQRLQRIEKKLEQIYSIREQIFALRFSKQGADSVRSSLASLFHDLRERERELNMLREHDSRRFIESLQLQSINMQHPTSVLEGKKLGSSTHQQFEYMKHMDQAPPAKTFVEEIALNKQDSPISSKRETALLTTSLEQGDLTRAQSTWRRLIRGVTAYTKFAKSMHQSRLNRDHKALSYIHKDFMHHDDGSMVSKKELRNEIDEVRALINELKGRRTETNTEKMLVEKLQARLREMDAAYTDMVLRSPSTSPSSERGVPVY